MEHSQQRLTELIGLENKGHAYVRRNFATLIDDAEDVVQDVIVRILKTNREIPNLSAFFFSAVKNACIDRIRSKSSKPTISLSELRDEGGLHTLGQREKRGREVSSEVETALSAEKVAELRETFSEALEALGTMTPHRQRAVVGRMLGMTVPQIARACRTSLPSAQKATWRGEKQLRERMPA